MRGQDECVQLRIVGAFASFAIASGSDGLSWVPDAPAFRLVSFVLEHGSDVAV
jgi:hypothetical protein